MSQQPSVIVLSSDLFFGMRIRNALKQLGYTTVLTKTPEECLEKYQEAALGIVDFNTPLDWTRLASMIESGLPVIAFGSHTDVDGFRAAKQAGVSRVISNGEFTRTLPDLIVKYASN